MSERGFGPGLKSENPMLGGSKHKETLWIQSVTHYKVVEDIQMMDNKHAKCQSWFGFPDVTPLARQGQFYLPQPTSDLSCAAHP